MQGFRERPDVRLPGQDVGRLGDRGERLAAAVANRRAVDLDMSIAAVDGAQSRRAPRGQCPQQAGCRVGARNEHWHADAEHRLHRIGLGVLGARYLIDEDAIAGLVAAGACFEAEAHDLVAPRRDTELRRTGDHVAGRFKDIRAVMLRPLHQPHLHEEFVGAGVLDVHRGNRRGAGQNHANRRHAHIRSQRRRRQQAQQYRADEARTPVHGSS